MTKRSRTSAATQTRRVLGAFWGALVLATAGSLYLNLEDNETRYRELAAAFARSVSETVAAMRDWNALHDGVYVLVSDKIQPNPYLEDRLRDVVTQDGMQLTKVNPAYMTRLVSEVLNSRNGVRMRMHSTNPLRPGNESDRWEESALARFSAGVDQEIYTVIPDRDGPTFRYVAPLLTEADCLSCHETQGYQLGDVRGGLSVAFTYAPFADLRSGTQNRILYLHGLFFAIIAALLAVLGTKLTRFVAALDVSLARVRTLEDLLPICASCKKIRKAGEDPQDQHAWSPVETYIAERTGTQFTHGLCPECVTKLYPEVAERLRRAPAAPAPTQRPEGLLEAHRR
ncbi:MAG: DUF3365 domain-containing protein [Deltaproteobacteria bacterium]|nr:DUF3365 domain-containing protein [Deltaproteobacteria bacterium]